MIHYILVFMYKNAYSEFKVIHLLL